MLDFKAKMYQIQFCWGILQCSPDPLAALRGPGPTSKGREGTRPHHFTPPKSYSGYAPGTCVISSVSVDAFYVWRNNKNNGSCGKICVYYYQEILEVVLYETSMQ